LICRQGLAAAEAARFRHVTSIYVDAQGSGLKLPEGLACGANGQVIVGDTGNDRLLRYIYRGGAMSGGTEIKAAQLSAPARVQIASKGDIYALDSTRRRVVHFGAEGDFKDALSFAGAPSADEVVARGLAVDAADNILVLDVFAARVLVLNPQGQFQKAIQLPSDVGFAADLAVDAAGNAVVLDSLQRQLFIAARDATAFTRLGSSLTSVLATLPSSIATTKGAILVADGIGSTIVTFGRDGAFVSRQLAGGHEEGLLDYPSQLCINDKDEAFVADRDNSRVQVFQVIR
jgi:DNA-binding beta-propeller fold protein YncE